PTRMPPTSTLFPYTTLFRSLTRKSRHAASRMQALYMGMYLIGCTYNFCVAHQELSKAKHWGRACTPAMASGLTDHVWSICELLRDRKSTRLNSSHLGISYAV